MKHLLRLLVVGVLVVSLTGCAGPVIAPVVAPPGLIITMTTVPLDTDLDKTEIGSKRGSATAVSILGLFSFGDAGVDTAARSGGIKVIHYADYRVFNMFMLFNSYTTVVYGE